MKLLLAIVALFACAAHADSSLFFGCDMKPVQIPSPVNTNGTGQVACYSYTISGAGGFTTMACTFKYAGLTSAPSAAHFHVGDATTASGSPTFFYTTGSSWSSATAGTVFQRFVATDTVGWHQVGTTTFDDQVTQCASGTGCYFNLHTANNGGGELRCELAPLTPTYNYANVILSPTPGAVNTTIYLLGTPIGNSAGEANVQMAQIGTSGVHVWGYEVSYLTGSALTASHIHQGVSTTDNSGALKVGFSIGAAAGATAGTFVGIAMEGIASTGALGQPSYWPSYTSDFDTALASHFCYINVHTTANPTGEIRANLAPNSATQATLALFAIVAMIASFLSL